MVTPFLIGTASALPGERAFGEVVVAPRAGGWATINNIAIAQGGFEKLVGDLAVATGFDVIWRGGPWRGTARLAALEAGIAAITI